VKIVFITDIDAGGVFAHYSNVINKYTDSTSNVIVGCDSYGYQSDLVIKKTGDARKIRPKKPYKKSIARKILQEADVIVCNEGKEKIQNLYWPYYVNTTGVFYFYGNIGTEIESYGKPTITNQPKFSDKVDYFIPTALDTDTSDFKVNIVPVETVRISHSTHDRKNKNTESFLKVVTYLTTDYDIEFDIIENCGYQKCIERKKNSQIGIDHIHEDYQYYGISSLENSALGLVNFVRMDEIDLWILREFFGINHINWEIVNTEGDMYSRIRYYIENTDKLFLEQCKTEAWFNACWDNKKIAKEFIKIFKSED
jgi:hypothetical protein